MHGLEVQFLTEAPSRIILMLAIPTLSVAFAVIVTVWPVSGEEGEWETETAGAVRSGLETVIVLEAVPVPPSPSESVSVAVYVPAPE
jgi:hypothetical protein